jgi:hypothetical protein
MSGTNESLHDAKIVQVNKIVGILAMVGGKLVFGWFLSLSFCWRDIKIVLR